MSEKASQGSRFYRSFSSLLGPNDLYTKLCCQWFTSLVKLPVDVWCRKLTTAPPPSSELPTVYPQTPMFTHSYKPYTCGSLSSPGPLSCTGTVLVGLKLPLHRKFGTRAMPYLLHPHHLTPPSIPLNNTSFFASIQTYRCSRSQDFSSLTSSVSCRTTYCQLHRKASEHIFNYLP